MQWEQIEPFYVLPNKKEHLYVSVKCYECNLLLIGKDVLAKVIHVGF